MTQSTKTQCAWCGVVFRREGPGRPAKYCRRSHRQRAYEAKQLAERRGIAPDEVLLSRRAWEQLRDALFRLQAAAEDVAMDVASGRATKNDYIDALAHLTVAVGDLTELSIEPTAVNAADTSQ